METFRQFTISAHELVGHTIQQQAKNELSMYGMEFDKDSKLYKNKYSLSEDYIDSIKIIAIRYGMPITERQAEATIDEIIDGKMQLNTIAKDTIAISERNSEVVVYLINHRSIGENIIFNIMDCKNGKHLKISANLFSQDTPTRKLYNKLSEMNLTDIDEFDAVSFYEVLSILSETYSQKDMQLKKLNNFKYVIASQLPTSFLCSYIYGFHHKSEFHMIGNRIKNSYNDKYLTPKQEERALRYLAKNKDVIGKRIELNPYQRFIDRRLTNGYLIASVKYERSGGSYTNIQIKLYDGTNIQKDFQGNYTIDELESICEQ